MKIYNNIKKIVGFFSQYNRLEKREKKSERERERERVWKVEDDKNLLCEYTNLFAFIKWPTPLWFMCHFIRVTSMLHIMLTITKWFSKTIYKCVFNEKVKEKMRGMILILTINYYQNFVRSTPKKSVCEVWYVQWILRFRYDVSPTTTTTKTMKRLLISFGHSITSAVCVRSFSLRFQRHNQSTVIDFQWIYFSSIRCNTQRIYAHFGFVREIKREFEKEKKSNNQPTNQQWRSRFFIPDSSWFRIKTYSTGFFCV